MLYAVKLMNDIINNMHTCVRTYVLTHVCIFGQKLKILVKSNLMNQQKL